jgi:uncharacterized iron-regulated membrane protein
VGVLGAPSRRREHIFNWRLAAIVVAFALYLPMLAVSIVLVLFAEKFVFPRFPAANRWLGLEIARAEA